ncbi:MAG: MFS transporter [Aggregatilineales bacterium]
MDFCRYYRRYFHIGGIYRLGKFLGPVIGGCIGLWFGLRAPFLLLAVLCVLAALVILVFMQADMPTEKEKHEHPGHANIGTVLREQRQILASAGSAQLLGQMIRGGRNTLIPLYAADVLGLDVATIGLIVGIGSFMDMLMVIPAGFVMDKLGRKWAIVPCFGLQALGMLFVPFSLTAVALVFAQVIMGLSNGIGSGSMMTLGSDLAPDDARGEFLGIWRFIGDGGFLAAPIIIGAVADILVLSSAAIVMSGAGFMAAGIFAVFVPETLKKDKQKRQSAST